VAQNMHMSRDELAQVRRVLQENGVDRRHFLRLAGALGVAAVGAPALLASGTPATALGKIRPRSGELNNRYGWMIAVNVPFFELSMTRWMEQELEGTGYELVVQSEDNNAVQAQQIMEQMLADRFAFIAKADGTPPEPYESLATIASEQGTYFQNHSVQPITGAGQNVLFDHAAAGTNIGTAAVEWATANGISTPIIGVLGNLGDPEGVKRTSVAVETITEAFPDTEVSGEVEAFADAQVGAEGAGNLLAANPNINMLLSFNSIAGLGAVQAATEAGKTDPTTFFLGMADTEAATQDLILSGDSVVQANWGALFEISAVLLIRDALKFADGETVPPTRALGGRLLRTAEDVEAYRAIAEDPTADSAADAYNDPSLVRYSDVALMTGQSINDVQ
jgi:ABC-type sugar transport system substrate-binding protein